MKVYHITPRENVSAILKEGFKSNRNDRISFCKENTLNKWIKIMKDHCPRGELSVLEVIVSDDFFNEEFFDWDKDEYSSGPKGEVSYGEGKNGWNDPAPRPVLKHGVNCMVSEKLDLSN